MTRVTKIEHLAVGSAIGCGTIIFTFVSIESAASIVLIGVFYGFFSGICGSPRYLFHSNWVDDLRCSCGSHGTDDKFGDG